MSRFKHLTKKIFSHYTDAVNEYQMTTDCLIFENIFKLRPSGCRKSWKNNSNSNQPGNS